MVQICLINTLSYSMLYNLKNKIRVSRSDRYHLYSHKNRSR